MKGLNLEQVEKVLNNNIEFICGFPFCTKQAVAPGFKINPVDEDFVKDLWNELFGEIISDEKFVDIISNDLNTFRSCRKHRRELEINIAVDPQEAQNILESIYRLKMEIKEDLTYKENNYKSLADCKKCNYHKGFMDEGFIRCICNKTFSVLIHFAPAFYLKGFKNGEIIVMCKENTNG